MVSITTIQATELCCSSAKAAIHNMESAWLSCNKTLFKKKSDKLDLAHRQWFAHPSSTSQIKAAKGKVHFWTFPPHSLDSRILQLTTSGYFALPFLVPLWTRTVVHTSYGSIMLFGASDCHYSRAIKTKVIKTKAQDDLTNIFYT